MEDQNEIIILLDEDDDDLRNATVIPARRGGRGRPTFRSQPLIVSGGGAARGKRRKPRPRSAGPIVRQDNEGLSIGTLVDAGAQVLAAIQSLPAAPVATGEVQVDVANLMVYQQAIAEHAKADERLRTIGSLASKLFA